MSSLNNIEITDSLLDFFCHHGIPTYIVCDNGTEFKNQIVRELLQLHKIELHFVTPHHPESDGQIERLHSTLLEHLRLLNASSNFKDDIKRKMKYAFLAYNNSAHSVTKLKPIDIINGHITTNTPLDIDINKLLASTYV